jgi:glycerol-3-phosphate dehydrogenase
VACFDLLIVGGGINGAGIARDASGRGLRVLLAEQDDLGSATSSASSKLIHGGLRYLEQLEFRLVAEALAEREVLLRTAPHLVRPMRFVMPHARELRPRWVIRTGLFLYDWLARRQTLPSSSAIDLTASPFGNGFKPRYAHGYVYSDCWVDDARLVIANARAAADAGAVICPRTRCVAAERAGPGWRVRLSTGRSESEVEARALVNAAGPWVAEFLRNAVRTPLESNVRLVQGSHIVVPRLYDGEHACILQNDDRRVVFAYPYEQHYTLVGTTDVEHHGAAGQPNASPAEIAYLCRAVNRYYVRQVRTVDVKWSYSGLRALVDDGTSDPSKVTRDYLLRLDAARDEAPVLSVIGGKITTYRRLAERALDKLRPWFPDLRPSWTGGASLPGGDMRGSDATDHAHALRGRYAWASDTLLEALARRHGSQADRVLDGAAQPGDLGIHFGADLYAAEVEYFIKHEWARTAEDVLWRRTKSGLHLDHEQQVNLFRYVSGRVADPL